MSHHDDVTDPLEEVELRQSFLAARLRALGAQLHTAAKETERLAEESDKLAIEAAERECREGE